MAFQARNAATEERKEGEIVMGYIYGNAYGSGQQEFSRANPPKGAKCKNCKHWEPSSNRMGLCLDRMRKGYSDVWSRGNGACLRFSRKKKGRIKR